MLTVTTYEQLALQVTEHLAKEMPARYSVNPTTSEYLQHLLFSKDIFWVSTLTPNVIKNTDKMFLYVDRVSVSFGTYDEPLHAKGYTFVDATNVTVEEVA